MISKTNLLIFLLVCTLSNTFASEIQNQDKSFSNFLSYSLADVGNIEPSSLSCATPENQLISMEYSLEQWANILQNKDLIPQDIETLESLQNYLVGTENELNNQKQSQTVLLQIEDIKSVVQSKLNLLSLPKTNSQVGQSQINEIFAQLDASNTLSNCDAQCQCTQVQAIVNQIVTQFQSMNQQCVSAAPVTVIRINKNIQEVRNVRKECSSQQETTTTTFEEESEPTDDQILVKEPSKIPPQPVPPLGFSEEDDNDCGHVIHWNKERRRTCGYYRQQLQEQKQITAQLKAAISQVDKLQAEVAEGSQKAEKALVAAEFLVASINESLDESQFYADEYQGWCEFSKDELTKAQELVHQICVSEETTEQHSTEEHTYEQTNIFTSNEEHYTTTEEHYTTTEEHYTTSSEEHHTEHHEIFTEEHGTTCFSYQVVKQQQTVDDLSAAYEKSQEKSSQVQLQLQAALVNAQYLQEQVDGGDDSAIDDLQDAQELVNELSQSYDDAQKSEQQFKSLFEAASKLLEEATIDANNITIEKVELDAQIICEASQETYKIQVLCEVQYQSEVEQLESIDQNDQEAYQKQAEKVSQLANKCADAKADAQIFLNACDRANLAVTQCSFTTTEEYLTSEEHFHTTTEEHYTTTEEHYTTTEEHYTSKTTTEEHYDIFTTEEHTTTVDCSSQYIEQLEKAQKKQQIVCEAQEEANKKFIICDQQYGAELNKLNTLQEAATLSGDANDIVAAEDQEQIVSQLHSQCNEAFISDETFTNACDQSNTQVFEYSNLVQQCYPTYTTSTSTTFTTNEGCEQWERKANSICQAQKDVYRDYVLCDVELQNEKQNLQSLTDAAQYGSEDAIAAQQQYESTVNKLQASCDQLYDAQEALSYNCEQANNDLLTCVPTTTTTETTTETCVDQKQYANVICETYDENHYSFVVSYLELQQDLDVIKSLEDSNQGRDSEESYLIYLAQQRKIEVQFDLTTEAEKNDERFYQLCKGAKKAIEDCESNPSAYTSSTSGTTSSTSGTTSSTSGTTTSSNGTTTETYSTDQFSKTYYKNWSKTRQYVCKAADRAYKEYLLCTVEYKAQQTKLYKLGEDTQVSEEDFQVYSETVDQKNNSCEELQEASEYLQNACYWAQNTEEHTSQTTEEHHTSHTTTEEHYTSTSESHTTEEHTSHTSEEHTSHTSEEHTSHTSEEHTSHTTSDFVRVTKYNAGDLMCAVGDYLQQSAIGTQTNHDSELCFCIYYNKGKRSASLIQLQQNPKDQSKVVSVQHYIKKYANRL